MGTQISIASIAKATLWIDEDTAYRITQFTLYLDKEPRMKAILERTHPYAHIMPDECTFPVKIVDNDIIIDLGDFSLERPAEID